MGEGTVHKTSCLCGAMRLELKGDPIFKVLCHCTICQKLTGSVAHNIAYKTEQVKVVKEDASWLDFKTSDKLTRRSCGTCAVTMMGKLEGDSACIAVPVGTIDRDGGPNDAFFLPQHEIFYGERICDHPDGLPKWAGFFESSEKLG